MTNLEIIERLKKISDSKIVSLDREAFYNRLDKMQAVILNEIEPLEILLLQLDHDNPNQYYEISSLINPIKADYNSLSKGELSQLGQYLYSAISKNNFQYYFETIVDNRHILLLIRESLKDIIQELKDVALDIDYDNVSFTNPPWPSNYSKKIIRIIQRIYVENDVEFDVVRELTVNYLIASFEDKDLNSLFQMICQNERLANVIKQMIIIARTYNYQTAFPRLLSKINYESLDTGTKLSIDVNLTHCAREQSLELKTKEYRNKKKLAQKMQKLISDIENNSILDIDPQLISLIDDETLLSIQLLIEQNQNALYQQLEQETSLESPSNSFDSLLMDTNINPKSLLPEVYNALKAMYIKIVGKEEIKVLKPLLDILKGHAFPIAQYLNLGLGLALANTNKDILMTILRMVDQKEISMNLLCSHFGILIPSTNNKSSLPALYEVLMSNYASYKHFNPNFTKEEGYNDEILLIDPKALTITSNILDDYNKAMDNSSRLTNTDLLVNPQTFNLVDYLLERGINPTCINGVDLKRKEASTIIDRIELASYIGKVILDDNGKLLPCIVTGIDYPALDHELKGCIYNQVLDVQDSKIVTLLNSNNVANISNPDPMISILDQHFSNTPSLYSINGLLVSRSKVIRGMAILQTNEETRNENIAHLLFNVIINNMVLSKDQIESIKRLLKDIGYDPDEAILTRRQESN